MALWAQASLLCVVTRSVRMDTAVARASLRLAAAGGNALRRRRHVLRAFQTSAAARGPSDAADPELPVISGGAESASPDFKRIVLTPSGCVPTAENVAVTRNLRAALELRDSYRLCPPGAVDAAPAAAADVRKMDGTVHVAGGSCVMTLVTVLTLLS